VPSLTIFAIPKRFEGHFAVIQRNAIRSWARLEPRPEIILMGSDEGTAGVAAEVGAIHIPDITSSPSGAPMLDDVFAKGNRTAAAPTVCFVNADIILTPQWLATVERVARWRARYLMVGRRWNLDVKDPLRFEDGWEGELIARAARTGTLAPSVFIDYFVSPRGMLAEVPPFVIGRPGYDNWLLWHARRLRAPIVEATEDAPAIHQNHDYSHIKAARADPGGRRTYVAGEDARRNAELTGDWTRHYSISHATHVARRGKIRRAIGRSYVAARAETLRRRIITATKPLRRRLGVDARFMSRLRSLWTCRSRSE
jgi:hypothetical protein